MERLTSGNGELDKILGGGFPGNAIHIIMGAPGTGKTILAEQLCFANASPDGGTVEVHSDPASGTTFTVTLPRHRTEMPSHRS